MTWLGVLLGGAVGSLARHGVNLATARLLGSAAPYATLGVNLAGSLLIGVVAGALVSERLTLGAAAQAFVFVGLLGGFTTFSSFMLDSLILLQNGATALALVNLIGQLVVGIVLVYAGYQIAL
jgi:fluoride exporter